MQIIGTGVLKLFLQRYICKSKSFSKLPGEVGEWLKPTVC